MARQSKKIYSLLINKIALVLFINQGLLMVLSSITATLEISLISSVGKSVFLDIIFRTLECIVYFVSFVIPVNIFNKMNKNTEKEIYEPKEFKKTSSKQAFFMIGLGLGATFIATFLNNFLVNTFSNYSLVADDLSLVAVKDYPLSSVGIKRYRTSDKAPALFTVKVYRS